MTATASSPVASEPHISFTHILGQGRVNQLGGVFINGRPLPQPIRVKIVEMASKGIKPCQISRQLRVSHGAVSKILNRFAETGSISPGQIGGNPRSRLAIQAVEKQITTLKEEHPHLCASELRDLLIEQEVCSRENAPTVSSINRHFRSRGLQRMSSSSVSSSSSVPVARKPRLAHSIESILGVSSDDSKSSSSDDDSAGGSPCAETRRNRTAFSSAQLDALEHAFRQNTYPDTAQREEISRITGLSEDKIMTWFSNRRARCRKNLPLGLPSPCLISPPPVVGPPLVYGLLPLAPSFMPSSPLASPAFHVDSLLSSFQPPNFFKFTL